MPSRNIKQLDKYVDYTYRDLQRGIMFIEQLSKKTKNKEFKESLEKEKKIYKKALEEKRVLEAI